MNRRHLMLGLSVPFTANALAGTPAASGNDLPSLDWCLRATVLLLPEVPHGKTPLGERTRAPIIGGSFEGPRIRGKVIPGGADWQLLRADGYLVLEADYFLEVDDGTAIRVHNRGLWHSPTGDWPADYALTTPEFEAPIGKHDWLNKHVFVGTVGDAGGKDPAVLITVYRVLPPRSR